MFKHAHINNSRQSVNERIERQTASETIQIYINMHAAPLDTTTIEIDENERLLCDASYPFNRLLFHRSIFDP